MRITTWNVNGIRAAIRKGIDAHLAEVDPDVLLLQEIRAFPEQIPGAWSGPDGWHVVWHSAERPGYAGTAILSKRPFAVMETGLGGPDPEGRVLRARIGKVQFVSVYLPSGSAGDERQVKKEAWMAEFFEWMKPLAESEDPVIVGGDLNIAHTAQDIHNPTGNKKNSGFLPHERDWFGDLLAQGWSDMVRSHYGDCQGPYSWWSNRGRARELDRGWRIDYLLGNAAASAKLKGADIHRSGGLEVSDHAPVSVDLSIKLPKAA